MIEEINELVKKREIFVDKWQQDDDANEEAKEIQEANEIEKQIIKLLSEGRKELPIDYILETITMMGIAPSLIYDDNGHWAVTDNGSQVVPEKESDNVNGFYYIEPSSWKETIREATSCYLDTLIE